MKRQTNDPSKNPIICTSVLAGVLLLFAGCAKPGTSSTTNTTSSAPPNPASAQNSSAKNPKDRRDALLPQINKWFADHNQRYASAIDDGGVIVVNIPGLKLSPDTEKMAKEFAASMGKQLTEAGFGNDFKLTDLGAKVSKTYQLKTIDVQAREAVLPAIDLWFLSAKKIDTKSKLDPADDTKLIVGSPAFNDDNHVTMAVEFGIKYGKQLRDLGFNPAFTVTDGKHAWTHKLY